MTPGPLSRYPIVIEERPVLDMLVGLREESGRDWYYLSTPLARRVEALLRACGRWVE